MDNGTEVVTVRDVDHEHDTGALFHVKDRLIEEGEQRIVECYFEKKNFTPTKSVRMSRMYHIGTISGNEEQLEAAARKITLPKRNASVLKPNCWDWYGDFLNYLVEKKIANLLERPIEVSPFDSRTKTGSSSNRTGKNLKQWFKRRS